jgi:hypothetical protein
VQNPWAPRTALRPSPICNKKIAPSAQPKYPSVFISLSIIATKNIQCNIFYAMASSPNSKRAFKGEADPSQNHSTIRIHLK